jgi:hypothetical protein
LENCKIDPRTPARISKLVNEWGIDVFIQDGLIWRRRTSHDYPKRNVIVLPQSLKQDVIEAAHGNVFAGHGGIPKTQDRIEQSYFWPSMTKDIAKHIEECTTCQHRRQQHHQKDKILSPLPICTQPNQRVHVDLISPLKTEKGKKMVICITDAFTKYAEIQLLRTMKQTQWP